jgi:hypothetical protein
MEDVGQAHNQLEVFARAAVHAEVQCSRCAPWSAELSETTQRSSTLRDLLYEAAVRLRERRPIDARTARNIQPVAQLESDV